VTEDELAAVVIALQALVKQPEEPAQPAVSAWKKAARLEAVGVQ
jgi:hypothetical protein